MSYLLCFMVEAPKAASQRKKVTPNNGVPSNFWYLLKSYGFIKNCHVIIEAKTIQKVLYSPSFRNNHFLLSCCVYFFPKTNHLRKVQKILFFKLPFFSKNHGFKKLTPN